MMRGNEVVNFSKSDIKNTKQLLFKIYDFIQLNIYAANLVEGVIKSLPEIDFDYTTKTAEPFSEDAYSRYLESLINFKKYFKKNYSLLLNAFNEFKNKLYMMAAFFIKILDISKDDLENKNKVIELINKKISNILPLTGALNILTLLIQTLKSIEFENVLEAINALFQKKVHSTIDEYIKLHPVKSGKSNAGDKNRKDVFLDGHIVIAQYPTRCNLILNDILRYVDSLRIIFHENDIRQLNLAISKIEHTLLFCNNVEAKLKAKVLPHRIYARELSNQGATFFNLDPSLFNCLREIRHLSVLVALNIGGERSDSIKKMIFRLMELYDLCHDKESVPQIKAAKHADFPGEQSRIRIKQKLKPLIIDPEFLASYQLISIIQNAIKTRCESIHGPLMNKLRLMSQVLMEVMTESVSHEESGEATSRSGLFQYDCQESDLAIEIKTVILAMSNVNEYGDRKVGLQNT
jgi:hypothetical protein